MKGLSNSRHLRIDDDNAPPLDDLRRFGAARDHNQRTPPGMHANTYCGIFHITSSRLTSDQASAAHKAHRRTKNSKTTRIVTATFHVSNANIHLLSCCKRAASSAWAASARASVV